ncbi:hypothetical protein SDC9_74202 [bioreactor metagenome]|uniref:Radical SAM core domain-containing protein n=1 Tax=bioreactor metagenome TaxID=1076179 RepID=A0A644YH97_9ZZZZ
MKIGLHDNDKTGFPNLALMKISAWHKARGDEVEPFLPVMSNTYDRVYSSKVFTFTDEVAALPDGAVRGGTGYMIFDKLPDEIDEMQPDYSLYPNHGVIINKRKGNIEPTAVGFLTRGCINKCEHCIVPRKEGPVRPYRTWEQVKRPDSKNILFLDNNVLALDYGIDQIERMGGADIRVDFNQGMDAMLITPQIAEKLARLKWIRFVRLSCDHVSRIQFIESAAAYLREAGVRAELFCYVLVKEIPDALRVVNELNKLGIKPFAQPFRPYVRNYAVPKEQARFANWVNKAATNAACTWEEYQFRK